MADPAAAAHVSPLATRGTALAGIWYYVQKIANGGITVSVGEVEVKNDTGNPVPVEGKVAEGQGASGNPVRTGWMAQDPTVTLPAENAGDIVTPGTDLNKRPLARQADLARSSDSVTAWGESVTLAANVASAASLSIRTSAGVVTSVEGVINAAAARYIQLHDVNGTPAGGAIPFAVTYAPIGISNFEFKIPRQGYPVSAGCTVIESTTLATYTATGATEMYATATHRGA